MSSLEIENEQKCGEVFITTSNVENMVFKCILCNNSFLEINKFTTHVKNHLMTCYTTNENKNALFFESDDNEDRKITFQNSDIVASKQDSSTINGNGNTMFGDKQLKTYQLEDKFEKQSEIRHINPYCCEICKKYFKTKYTFQRHQKSVHADLKSSFLNKEGIEITSKSNTTESYNEIKVEEYDNRTVTDGSATDDADDDDDDNQKANNEIEIDENDYKQKTASNQIIFTELIELDPLKCRYCDRRFRTKYVKNEHERIHTGEKPHQCKICNKSYRLKASYIRHLNTHKAVKPYQCDQCNASFAIQSNLKSHIERHIGIRKYKCEYCAKVFVIKGDLRIHEKKVHNEFKCGRKPPELYQCDQCGKSYRKSTSFQMHLRIHTGIKPYKCTICNASFIISGNLNIHLQRHNKEKRFQCTYCEKRFVIKSELQAHERLHTGERPFKCKICVNESFTTSSKLNFHQMRKHNTVIKPHQCSLCSRRFCVRKELLDHAVVHTDARPYTCDICQSTFPRRKSLISHKKIHSDVAEYVCKICGKAFKQSPGLYCHLKIHQEKRKED